MGTTRLHTSLPCICFLFQTAAAISKNLHTANFRAISEVVITKYTNAGLGVFGSLGKRIGWNLLCLETQGLVSHETEKLEF